MPIDLAWCITDLQSPSRGRPDNRNSDCLILAISYMCFKLTWPTISWPGRLDPFRLPFFPSGSSAAFRKSQEVCGVRTSKWKDRSARTVTRVGIGVPAIMCAVRALNSCHKVSLAYLLSRN
jgi:hypothetical protein